MCPIRLTLRLTVDIIAALNLLAGAGEISQWNPFNSFTSSGTLYALSTDGLVKVSALPVSDGYFRARYFPARIKSRAQQKIFPGIQRRNRTTGTAARGPHRVASPAAARHPASRDTRVRDSLRRPPDIPRPPNAGSAERTFLQVRRNLDPIQDPRVRNGRTGPLRDRQYAGPHVHPVIFFLVPRWPGAGFRRSFADLQ